jgi:hypothetical protein
MSRGKGQGAAAKKRGSDVGSAGRYVQRIFFEIYEIVFGKYVYGVFRAHHANKRPKTCQQIFQKMALDFFNKKYFCGVSALSLLRNTKRPEAL